MSKEEEDALARFMTRRTDPGRLSRGRSIYSRRALKVKTLDFSGSGYAQFEVASDFSYQFYEVELLHFLTPAVVTKCTCSDDGAGLCKHRVAAILLVIDQMPDLTKLRFDMTSATVDMPIISELSIRNNTTDQIWKERSKIKKIAYETTDSASLYAILTYKNEDFRVSFQRITGTKKLETTCSCGLALHAPLCIHKVSVLLKVFSEMGPRAFELMRDFKSDKNALLADYGYSLDDDIKDKFGFKLDDDGTMQLVNLDPTIQKIGLPESWQRLKASILKSSQPSFIVPAPAEAGRAEQRVPLFVFWTEKSTAMIDFGFGIYSARYNEKTKKVVSIKAYSGGDRQYYYGTDEVLLMTEAQSRLNQMARNLKEEVQLLYRSHGWYFNPYYNVENLGREQVHEIRQLLGKQIKSIFQHLDDSDFVFIAENGHVSTANDLSPVKVCRQEAGLFFTLTKDKEFIILQPYLELPGQSPVPLKQTARFNSFWLGLSRRGELFRWGTMAHAELVAFLRQNGFLVRVKKEFSTQFIRDWVIPLCEQFDVEFQTDHVLEKERLTLGSTRLYLKEDDRHLLIVPQFVYLDKNGNELEMMYDEKKTLSTFENDLIKVLERDNAREAAVWNWLSGQHLLFPEQDTPGFFYVPFDQVMQGMWLLNFIDQAKEKGHDVLGFKDLKKMKFSPYRGQLKVRASSGIDWFDMGLEMSFGGQSVSLKDLQKALLKKQNFVTLKDGTIGMLPEEWINKLNPLIRLGQVKGDNLQVSKLHFSVIEALTAEIDEEEIRRELEDKRQKLLGFKNFPDVSIPSNVKATLRHYQQEGLKWLNFLDEFGWGGCLADDMGLGKTLQILTFLQQKKQQNPSAIHLVVVPTSLVFNWEAEAARFTPDLKFFVHRGTTRLRDATPFRSYDVILTTYGVMRSDIELFRSFPFHYIVLDEAQAIKNPESLLSKAARLLTAKNRITMTGTPVENNTFDLYAQFDFLNPGMLGNAEFFKTQFANPIDKHQDKVAAEQLRGLVYPFLLKRTKEEVATDLPDKTETTLFCEMGKKQRKVYDTFREKYRMEIADMMANEGKNKAGFLVLEGLLKLRQICSSPAILSDSENYGEESAKLDEIIRELQENASNHKILVFSQFLGMLDLIRQSLIKLNIPYEYLDGQTTDRADRVNRFQSDNTCRVFLMSLKAGGVGLNLTEADYVYLIDPWWNPAVERQAIDRTHRIGQTRKVFAYKMICKDTIEEKILLLQQRKKTLADDLVGSEAGFIKKLTSDDIMNLFS